MTMMLLHRPRRGALAARRPAGLWGPLAWLLLAALAAAMPLAARAAPASAIAWPAILFPDKNLSPYWVAELIVQNKIPMQIQAFDVDGDTRKAQRFYQEWLGGKADFSETTLDGIPILGARDGNFRITVEFRPLPSGKQQVRISSAWLHGAVPQLVSDQLQRRSHLAVPMGSDEFSDTFSFDADRVNRTSVWGNTLSVEANELYIREQALVAGWTVLSRKTIKGGTRAQVVLRRGGQEAVIAIAHNGVGCSIVISNTLPQA
ncbi:hypothetical protein WH303_12595 [Comamonas sp. MYb69]|uniref:hypothetical protein n=2 Tax=unclassified Comamonas TaxID=2638500 RepID=UPI0030B2910B